VTSKKSYNIDTNLINILRLKLTADSVDKDFTDLVVNYARKVFMKLTAVTVTKTFFWDPKRSFVPDEKKSLNGEEQNSNEALSTTRWQYQSQV
jgi:hypothetical protein